MASDLSSFFAMFAVRPEPRRFLWRTQRQKNKIYTELAADNQIAERGESSLMGGDGGTRSMLARSARA